MESVIVLQAIKAPHALNYVVKASMAKVAASSAQTVLIFLVTLPMAVVFVQVVLLEVTALRSVMMDSMVLIVNRHVTVNRHVIPLLENACVLRECQRVTV
jgi:hypothetical protein